MEPSSAALRSTLTRKCASVSQQVRRVDAQGPLVIRLVLPLVDQHGLLPPARGFVWSVDAA